MKTKIVIIALVLAAANSVVLADAGEYNFKYLGKLKMKNYLICQIKTKKKLVKFTPHFQVKERKP